MGYNKPLQGSRHELNQDSMETTFNFQDGRDSENPKAHRLIHETNGIFT